MIRQRTDRERSSEKNRKDLDQECRTNGRRRLESKGYTYISMVGWMDRRENKRRADDSFKF